MAALEFFESILASVRELRDLENEILSLETQAGPHGQQVGSVGGSGGCHDGMRGIDRLVDGGMRERLEQQRATVRQQVNSALKVLYGKSDKGGLAKARNSTDADIICCHYLQGMGWTEIAREIVKPDSKSPGHWCQMRARRALEYIDRVGADALANS